MPKYIPAPELKKRLADPIEFELKGRQFKIDVVPTTIYAKLSSVAESQNAIDTILELLVGVEEFKELGPVDGREAIPLVNWLSEIITEGLTPEEKKTGVPSPK